MMASMRTLLLAVLLAAPAPAFADAAALFREGRFAEAAQAGAEEVTPDALVLAARSTLAVAAYGTSDKTHALRLCERARRLADEALSKRPGDPAALLQKGIALGYIAKLERSPGTARQARKLMDEARAADPDAPLAWAALGGWHGETVATLGGFVAGTLLGARKAEAVRAFEAALARDRSGAIVPTFYAFTLLALDADNAPRARELLIRAAGAAPRGGFEALLKRQAERVLTLLRANDAAGARALAKRLQPFGTLS